MTSTRMDSGKSTASAAEPIPFLDLRTPHLKLEAELTAAFTTALRSAHFVGGAEVDAFEREFAAYCQAPWSVGLNSGTDALRFAFIALGLAAGREVITASHTFIATSEAITQAGGRVRFVDIDDETMTLDPAAAEAAISDKTAGMVPVHLYGQAADLDPMLKACAKRGLWLVEDACQAHGATYQGKKVGSLGDLGTFSFYPGKNLGSLGEGGAVTGKKDGHKVIIKQQREHGQSEKYIHETEGYNGRLHAIQAAFLRIKLRHLEEWNAGRRRAAAWYRDALSGISDVRIPPVASYAEHVYHLYVIRTEKRDALRDHLAGRGIGTGFHYPKPLHLQRAYASLGMKQGSLPKTEEAAATCLSLPMFPELTQSQVGRVADAVREFFGR